MIAIFFKILELSNSKILEFESSRYFEHAYKISSSFRAPQAKNIPPPH